MAEWCGVCRKIWIWKMLNSIFIAPLFANGDAERIKVVGWYAFYAPKNVVRLD